MRQVVPALPPHGLEEESFAIVMTMEGSGQTRIAVGAERSGRIGVARDQRLLNEGAGMPLPNEDRGQWRKLEALGVIAGLVGTDSIRVGPPPLAWSQPTATTH